MRIARGGKSLRQLNSGGGTPASPPPPSVQFSTPSVTLAEGNSGTTNFVYTVTRTGDTTGASSVDWAVTGSGVNPANAADFVGGTLPSGTLSFIAGDTSKTITVPVQGDTTVEPDETFTVTLSNPVNATIGSPSTAAGTITNDDSAGGTGLAAPTLAYPSPIASNPTSITIKLPVDWQTGDVLKLAYSASAAMTTPTVLTHTITDADIAAGTFSMGLSGITFAGVTYFQAYGNHAGVDSTNLSGIVAWGDTTAPVISTSGTQSNTETTTLAITLAATDTGGVPALVSDGTTPGWYIAGGVDQLQYEIANVGGVPTLRWYQNGTHTAASPTDQDVNGTYLVNIVAVDYSGNQSSPLALTTTVNAIDQTPNSFTFTDQSNVALSTLTTSNTVTISGLEPGFNIASSVSGGEYQKNGGTWQPAGSFVMANGDTLAVRATSSGSYSTPVNVVATVGTYSDTFTITTMANPSAVGFTPSSNQPADYSGASVTTVTFTAIDFIAGNPLVYVKPTGSTRASTAVKIIGAGAGGTDIVCTEVNTTTSGDNSGLWVGATPVAASGTYSVQITWNLSLTAAGMMAGTLTGTSTPTSPSTVKLDTASHTNPNQTVGTLTIPTNGLGLFCANSSLSGTKTTPAPATIVVYDGVNKTSFIVTNLTAGAGWQPSFNASGTGFSSILAAAWGP